MAASVTSLIEHFNFVSSTQAKKKKKNTLVSGNAGDEKNLQPGGCDIVFNRFSGGNIFFSLLSFDFFYSCVLCLFI